jgi:antitoxin YefM
MILPCGRVADAPLFEPTVDAPGPVPQATPGVVIPIAVYSIRYTPGMAKIVPVREFRTKLSELLSDVADRRDHVLVTRNGKPAAALVPIDEYEALEETAEILSDSGTLEAIEAGLAELARGDSVTLDDLRRDLAERRAAG